MFDRCWLWRKRLSRRADGTLPPRQCEALQEHLSRCVRCCAAAAADRALHAALEVSYTPFDIASARRFDDRVVASLSERSRLSLSRLWWRSWRRLCARYAVEPLAFLSQIAAGSLAAAAVTALCLVPTLHPEAADAQSQWQNRQANMGRVDPPVPLESLLQTSSPRAALLWTLPRARLQPSRPPALNAMPVPIQPADGPVRGTTGRRRAGVAAPG